LHHAGFAHSYEVWDGDGNLVAGGYGVASGRAQWGFHLARCEIAVAAPELARFTQMPRDEYVIYLSRPLAASRPGHWHGVPALCGLA
jgi:hypothetical protein